MQKAYLFTDDGKRQDVYLLDAQDVNEMRTEKKSNFKDHLYIGYLVIATLAFGLGFILTLKKLKAK